jgi:two-component system chemotaxis response regulator CheY
MKILIAEDDKISQKVLCSIVSKVGDCEVADNGEEAFDKYCQSLDSNQPFDIIFLDVMMPEVDGQEALAAIREFESQRGISNDNGVKVIMTTALDDGQNLYHAHANGCVNYLVKPLSRDKVLNAIKKLGLGTVPQ